MIFSFDFLFDATTLKADDREVSLSYRRKDQPPLAKAF